MNICRERILSEEYRDFIVTPDIQFVDTECVIKTGFISEIAYVEKEKAEPIRFDRYPYYTIPKCYTLLDVQAMNQAGIIQVQNYPTLELQGTGVLVGFIDTGIDYRNPLFRNIDGSTRIVSIWDQTIQSDIIPENLHYGTVYNANQIDEALQSGNPLSVVPSMDENGHGTFLSSLAVGGADEANQFVGAAPDSKIAIVKLKPAKKYLKDFYLIGTEEPCYQENDIMLGIVFLHQLAERLNLPLVICVALGTNMGSHAASSPLTGMIDILGNMANRSIVIGGGNEANQRHHYLGNSRNQTESVEVRVAENASGFCMELWSGPLDIFAVSVVSPSGEQTYQFPLRSNQTQVYDFLLEGTRITIDYKVFVERLDAELVFFRFINPTPGIWKILVEPVQVNSGIFHMWLPITEFLENEVYFLKSNPDYTITEPGSSLTATTVAFYNGNDNSVDIRSGRGYTRTNRIKPDFAAPGVNVSGAGMNNQYRTRTGSSIATGITTGAVALIMEWVVYRLQQENIDSTQIRNLLVLGTVRRPNEIYPNREWGYGQLNVYNTFEVIRQI